MPPGGIRTQQLTWRAAADLRHRQAQRMVTSIKRRCLQIESPELAILISSRQPANTSNSAVLFVLLTI